MYRCVLRSRFLKPEVLVVLTHRIDIRKAIVHTNLLATTLRSALALPYITAAHLLYYIAAQAPDSRCRLPNDCDYFHLISYKYMHRLELKPATWPWRACMAGRYEVLDAQAVVLLDHTV